MSSQDESRSLLRRIWRSIVDPFKQMHERNQEIARVNTEYHRFIHSLEDAPAPNSLLFLLLVCKGDEIESRISFLQLLDSVSQLEYSAHRPFVSEKRLARIMDIRAEMNALIGPNQDLTMAWLERAKTALDEIVAMQ